MMFPHGFDAFWALQTAIWVRSFSLGGGKLSVPPPPPKYNLYVNRVGTLKGYQLGDPDPNKEQVGRAGIFWA